MKHIGIGVCVVLSVGALLVGQRRDASPSGKVMASAAEEFLASLTETQREAATFEFESDERLNWHFIPRERKGVPLRDLSKAAKQTAHRLIRSGLSEAGYGQALDVMSLEEVLYLLEGGDRAERRERRNPEKYYLSIFGTPGDDSWGWRVEGHHLSLNYTIVDGELVSTTPEFFGANPGTIEAGPGRELRVLGSEEDIARQILKLCSDTQSEVAWIDKEAPADIRGGGEPQPEQTDPVGLPFAKMSDDQKKLMGELLAEYLRNMPSDVSRQRRNQIANDGMDQVYFAWWGGSERNEPHYYRVQGPSFLIEYNNTQNNANHVHSIWRNLSGDFNIAL